MPLSDYLLPYRPGRATVIDQVSTNLWYVGYVAAAKVPDDLSTPVFLIQRITSSGGSVQSEYAGDGAFNSSWVTRTSYFDTIPQTNTYSTDFDGVNDQVQADYTSLIAALGTQYAASAWVKFNAFTSRCIFSVSHSTTANVHKIFLGANSTGKAQIEVRTDAGVTVSVSDTFTMSTGVWYHIVGVRNGTTVTVYVNGVANASASAAINTTITNNVVTLGAWRYGATPTNFLSGRIDSVTVWNTALTSAEVLELYTGGGAFDASSHSRSAYLQAWWKMGDDDAFPTIYDHSGNNYHGTMANMTSTDFVEDTP